MKKRNLQRIFAAFMATAMVVGATACNKSDDGDSKATDAPTQAPATTDAPTTTDAPATTDEPTKAPGTDDAVVTVAPEVDVDLGGINVIIRDWWNPTLEEQYPKDPVSAYEIARNEYRDEMMKKYNFTIREAAISDWGAANTDFVDYVNAGGDDQYYIFTLHIDPTVANAMASGLMYDLHTLDCLDFSDVKFQRNKMHEQMSIGSSYYAFFPGYSEPRTGVYFNKQVLTDAGIDPDSLYDMQAAGTWTWDEFEKIMAACQRDLNSDGVDDIYGLTLNESVMTDMAVLSNNGSYVSKTADGKYVYNLEAPETLEALEWCVDMYTKYDNHDPEGASWDYYQEEWRAGKAAFLVEQEYAAAPGNLFEETDFEMGFVCFPKGPQASNYASLWANNAYVIPGCYDADKAWKIAFAWNVFTNPVPGFENVNGYMETAQNGNFDQRTLDETLPLMADPSAGVLVYTDFVSGIETGPQLTWSIGANASVSSIVEGIRDQWKKCIEDANK